MDRNDTDSNGVMLALAGFVLLSMGDAVVKTMATDWAPSAIATLRYSLGAAGLSALLLAREGRAGFALTRPGLQLVRGASVATATIGFFAALSVMPLAEATTIVFVSPIIVGALAPLVLGERGRAATWIASAIAFAGVLVVLRPNLAAVGAAALLPLLSAFAMSALVIANRAVAGQASPLAMQAMLALVATPILLLATIAGHFSGIDRLAVGMPPPVVLAKCALVACTASAAHWLIFLGTTRAGAATIAPTTYVQLIVATALGWLFFGDGPDGYSLVGAALIVGAGLYLWQSGRVRSIPPTE